MPQSISLRQLAARCSCATLIAGGVPRIQRRVLADVEVASGEPHTGPRGSKKPAARLARVPGQVAAPGAMPAPVVRLAVPTIEEAKNEV